MVGVGITKATKVIFYHSFICANAINNIGERLVHDIMLQM
jgi:hypothetical protein